MVTEPRVIRTLDKPTRHPLCRGYCAGERSPMQGPQRQAISQDGRRILMCPCCNTELTAVVGKVNSPQKLAPDVVAGRRRLMQDNICGYDVWWLDDLKAR
jgi:hypothetical protein